MQYCRRDDRQILGGPFIGPPMMPRDANLSEGCTPAIVAQFSGDKFQVEQQVCRNCQLVWCYSASSNSDLLYRNFSGFSGIILEFTKREQKKLALLMYFFYWTCDRRLLKFRYTLELHIYTLEIHIYALEMHIYIYMHCRKSFN